MMINCSQQAAEFEYVAGSHQDAALQDKIETSMTYHQIEAQPLVITFRCVTYIMKSGLVVI
jgi:hypothetical protein